VSPILTRPVREQLEHDRVIRQLQVKYKRKTDVIINPANEQNQSITVGDLVVYPDVLVFAEGSRRLLATVEVETGESVNAIEARAEWGVYSKLKVPLHLYVPTVCVDAARRICDEYQILVSELWSYATAFDQVRFTLVHKSPDAPTVKVPAAAPERSRASKPAARPAAKAKRTPTPKPTAKAKSKPKPKARPAAKAKPARKAKPAPTLRQAQGRHERSQGTKKGAKKRR
jgi:hypothetical protein